MEKRQKKIFKQLLKQRKEDALCFGVHISTTSEQSLKNGGSERVRLERQHTPRLKDGRMLRKMRAQYGSEMERHEALVVDNDTGHELRLLPILALEQESLCAADGVEQQRF